MIIANFDPRSDYKRVSGLDQWDYGQQLRIQGLDLPVAVEIHFSLTDVGGEAITRIGTTADGVTDVIIPDSMLENGEEMGEQYSIFAYVYLSDTKTGKTIKKIEMIVSTRPKPQAWDKPEDEEIFREAIEAVNVAADRAETAEENAAESAESAKEGAAKTAEDRKKVEELVEMTADIEEQVEEVKQYKEQAQTAATNAALSEEAAKSAQEAAQTAQTAAESAEDAAEQNALAAAGDKAEVERMAGQVATDKQTVAQDKADVEKAVSNFTLTAQQAIADVNNAGQAQTERVQGTGDTAVQNVNTAKDAAVQEVNSTKDAAVQSVNAAGQEQVAAVQEEGQKVIDSIPEDYQTAMAGKVDKQQGKENAGKVLGIDEDGNVVPVEQSSGGIDFEKISNLLIKPQTEQAELLKINDSADFPVLEVSGQGWTKQNGQTGESPSPEHPQNIMNEGVYNQETQKYERTIRVSNKNLFDKKIAENKENWTAGINYPYMPVWVGKGNKICVSYKKDLQKGLGFYACVSKTGGSSSDVYGWLYHSTAETLIKKTLTFTAEEDYIFLSATGANVDTQKFMENIGNDLQIEISESPTAYVEHAEQSVTITSDRPVSKWDRLECRGGVYGWAYRTKYIEDLAAVIPDNTPIHGKDSPYFPYELEGTDLNYDKTKIITEVGVGNEKYQPKANTKSILIHINQGDTIQTAKEHLHYKIIYETTEKEEWIPLSHEEQQALKELCTYYPKTIISTDTGLLLQANYVADTQTYIQINYEPKVELENIKERVEALERAAIK